jgi:tetratricopeptide (TPR) repeat protein
MSWISWLFLLAGLYLLVVLVRGAVQFVSWCVEEYIFQPTKVRHRDEKSPHQPAEVRSKAASERRRTEGQHDEGGRAAVRVAVKSAVAVKSVGQTRRPSRVGRFLKLLKVKIFTGSYEHWVESALSESDLAIKVEYLSKALKLNPTYLPALGMKGYALFELERYAEAVECFDKCLEANPNALTRYKKGICCYRVRRREEALKCLSQAMEECAGQDRLLLEDVSRMKKLVEDELRNGEASGAVTTGGNSQGSQDAPRALEDAHEENRPRSPGVHEDNNVILVM